MYLKIKDRERFLKNSENEYILDYVGPGWFEVTIKGNNEHHVVQIGDERPRDWYYVTKEELDCFDFSYEKPTTDTFVVTKEVKIEINTTLTKDNYKHMIKKIEKAFE